jgi:hypothetical protein
MYGVCTFLTVYSDYFFKQIFVMAKCRVFFEVRIEFLNCISTGFGVKGLSTFPAYSSNEENNTNLSQDIRSLGTGFETKISRIRRLCTIFFVRCADFRNISKVRFEMKMTVFCGDVSCRLVEVDRSVA